MAMSGLILLAFIIYHLLHFTVRTTDPRFLTLPKDPLGHYDVYSMMVLGFQQSARLRLLYPLDVPARAPSQPWFVEFFPVLGPE